MIRFHNVYKTIAKKPVVNGITFDFLRGNIYCLNVQSEICHDTICALLTEYAVPTIGEVQTIGTLCQITDSYLTSGTMVIRYLEYIVEFAKKRNPNLSYAAIATVLKILELEEVKFKRITDLSEFQKERVKLASGILADCEILVITKPVVGLSNRIRDKLFAFLQIYKKDRTVIFLTRQGGKDYVFDEYIEIKSGRIVKIESTKG